MNLELVSSNGELTRHWFLTETLTVHLLSWINPTGFTVQTASPSHHIDVTQSHPVLRASLQPSGGANPLSACSSSTVTSGRRGTGELSSRRSPVDAAETRWLCAQEEQRRRAEAMQRRKQRRVGGEESTPVCPVRSSKEQQSRRRTDESLWDGVSLLLPLPFRVTGFCRFEFFLWPRLY